MSIYKVGDLVKIVKNPDVGHVVGDTGTVTVLDNPATDFDLRVSIPGKSEGSYNDDEVETVYGVRKDSGNNNNNKGDNMSNITEEIKNLELSDADRLLLEHGIINSEGDLTEEGKDIVIRRVFLDKKDDIVAAVQKVAKAKSKK